MPPRTGLSRRQILLRGTAVAGGAVATSILAACGGNDSSSTESSSASGNAPKKVTLNKTVEITLWTWAWPPPDGGAAELVAAFEKAEPKIKLEVKQYPYPDYVTALKTGVPNKTTGEVLALETGSMTRQYAEFLLPVEDRLKEEWGPTFEDDFLPGAVQEIRDSVPDGKTLVAVPQQASNGGIVWYSKSLFEKAGVDVPKSYDDLVQVAAMLRENDIIPMAWGAKDQWPNTDWLLQFVSQYKPNAVEQAEAGEIPFTDPAIVSGLAFMPKSIKDGIWNKAPFATTAFPEAYGTFTGGKSAMTALGTWGLNLFKPEQLADFGAFLFPNIPGASGNSEVTGRTGFPTDVGPNPSLPWKTDNVTNAIPAGMSKDKTEAAMRFATYWAGPEGQKAGAQIFTPARKGVANPLVTPEFKQTYDWMNSLTNVAEARQFQYAETRVALQDAIANVCVKGADPKEELARVNTAVDRARRRAS